MFGYSLKSRNPYQFSRMYLYSFSASKNKLIIHFPKNGSKYKHFWNHGTKIFKFQII